MIWTKEIKLIFYQPNNLAYGYLALEGGFDIKPFCNSVSILARAQIGPNEGKKIKIK